MSKRVENSASKGSQKIQKHWKFKCGQNRKNIILRGREELKRLGLFQERDQIIYSEEEQKPSQFLLEDSTIKGKRLKDEGMILAEAGRYGAAIAKWEEALEFDNQNYILYELQAQAYMELSDFYKAIQKAQKSVELNAHWPCAYVTLGRSQLNFGELELSHSSFLRALALDPDNEELKQEINEVKGLLQRKNDLLKIVLAEKKEILSSAELQVHDCKSNLSLRAKVLIDHSDEK